MSLRNFVYCIVEYILYDLLYIFQVLVKLFIINVFRYRLIINMTYNSSEC